ncbi:MFS transporter [Bosea sp. TAB14]|uniref:MFS transporter n=1 Tax=Bosea sp. TAB14 TaxID=3237481 RepID=UPI003F92CE06
MSDIAGRRADEIALAPVAVFAAGTPVSPPAAMSRDKIELLLTGLAGSFLVNLSAQFIPTNIADLQGGLGATPDEASWVATVYTMTSFAGIIMSGTLIKTFGLGRYMASNAIIFALTALACAMTPTLPYVIGLRAVQGLAAGSFGPIAFVSVFMTMTGPRLPFGMTILAFVLLFPTTIGPIVSGFAETILGWEGLFVVQAIFGAMLIGAALTFIPRPPVNWQGLKADWAAIGLLSTALALAILVLNQGTRRFWFENDMIVWCTAAGVAAWAGFIFVLTFSPLPLIAPSLLLNRKFGIPITLNLVFRSGFVVTTYLVPQFLGIVQGYRPLELANLLLWLAMPQLIALPVAWWLLHRLDGRLVMGAGLLLCGAGTFLLVNGTSLYAADQFRLTLVVFGIGQLLFLVPDLLIGGGSLKPADLPTASLAFNMTTLGGTTLGVALVSNLVTERQKFHSNVITDAVSLYSTLDSDRVAAVVGAFGNRLVDDAQATARAVGFLANLVRREAWVLSFNDAFLVVAVTLAVSAIGVIAIGRCPPLSRHEATQLEPPP